MRCDFAEGLAPDFFTNPAKCRLCATGIGAILDFMFRRATVRLVELRSGPDTAPDDGSMAKHRKTRAVRPTWDVDRRELRLGGVVLKRFRRAADNQMLVLDVFQEEGWPHQIDDPLPRDGDVDPKARLKETVKSLNEQIKDHAIIFGVSHHGERATWHFRASDEAEERS